jgi:hypothetical protein
MLTAALGCVDEAERDDLAIDDIEVRAGSLLPQNPPGDPQPPDPSDPQPPPIQKVCKPSCEACADLHKGAYECLAYDKSFDQSPDPLAAFACVVCDNDGPASAVSTCETQAKIQGVFFTDMEVDRLACGPIVRDLNFRVR